jgi:hypothetical protein
MIPPSYAELVDREKKAIIAVACRRVAYEAARRDSEQALADWNVSGNALDRDAFGVASAATNRAFDRLERAERKLDRAGNFRVIRTWSDRLDRWIENPNYRSPDSNPANH